MRRTRRGRSEKTLMETTDRTEIRRLCLEFAKAEHSRAEDSRRKECKKTGETYILRRFDPEDLPEIDDTKNTLLGTAWRHCLAKYFTNQIHFKYFQETFVIQWKTAHRMECWVLCIATMQMML